MPLVDAQFRTPTYTRYMQERWIRYVLASAKCGQRIASYKEFHMFVVGKRKKYD